ncbi:tyrosine-type recombinase/integrase [Candidatus Woesearchaeota archaeon]|nr:tyrosine-type recombinase/integrase [Candidatus Woesearchaeota archaeon]MBD3283356.1 tyrosine-type recombinase/integrase [Candidatus Pacearchaeota archaeon]
MQKKKTKKELDKEFIVNDIDDLYKDRNKYYSKQLKKLNENKKITDYNKEWLKKFCIFSKGKIVNNKQVKPYTVGKNLSELIWIFERVDKDIPKLGVFDLHEIMDMINSRDRSEATKSHYRRVIKQFYSWYEDFDERLFDDDRKKWMRTKRIYKYLKSISGTYKRKKIDPREVLNDEDLKIILKKGCKTIQDKAILYTLHETGMRAADLLLTKISGFSVDSRGIGTIICGNGKTGGRPINVIRCVTYIQEHIKNHPFKNKPDYQLFYFKFRRGNIIKRYTVQRLYNRVKRIIKRSGVNKKHNPHWFRHSRASIDQIESTMSDQVIKRRMGWSKDSKMIANYSHLGNKEIRRAWMRSVGIQEKEEKKKELITCICRRVIDGNLSYCPFCGRPTSLKVMNEEKESAESLKQEISAAIKSIPDEPEKRREFLKAIDFAMELMNDPKKRREFEEKKTI